MKIFYVRSCETDIAFDEFLGRLAEANSAGLPQSCLRFEANLEDLPKELEADVFAGKLPVKNPLTGGPQSFPIGDALRTSRVLVKDIPDYVKERGVTVAVMPEVTQQAHVVAVDPQLKNFPRHAPVYYTHKNGAVSGAGIAKVGDFIDSENERITRQSEGYFTLDEAAEILAPVSGEDSANLVRDMQTAHREDKLIVRNPVHKRPIPRDKKSSWSDLVMPADVDAWLDSQGVDYRFPKATQPLIGNEASRAQSTTISIQQTAGQITANIETQQTRRARRYQLCIDAGLTMPQNDYSAMPRGIGAIAKKENITRQAFVEDIKAHINTL
jgi:hypothetical protein